MFSNDKIKNQIAINSKGIRRATRPSPLNSLKSRTFLAGAMSGVNVGNSLGLLAFDKYINSDKLSLLLYPVSFYFLKMFLK